MGPYLLEDDSGNVLTVMTGCCVYMIENFFTLQLAGHPEVSEGTWFQQGRVPCYTTRISMNTLKHLFPNCVIFGNGDIPRPARSPDFRACSFFLWVQLKSKVLIAPPPQNIPKLEYGIQEDVTTIPVQILCCEMNRAHSRLEECVSRNRGHIQNVRLEKKSPMGNKLYAFICTPEICKSS